MIFRTKGEEELAEIEELLFCMGKIEEGNQNNAAKE